MAIYWTCSNQEAFHTHAWRNARGVATSRRRSCQIIQISLGLIFLEKVKKVHDDDTKKPAAKPVLKYQKYSHEN